MKRKKSKPNAYQRQLAAEWEKIVKAAAKPLERGAKSKGQQTDVIAKKTKKEKLTLVPHINGQERESNSRALKSKGDLVGNGVKKADKVYTGTSMLGVATLHKSNAIPVFQVEDAKDISKMRR